MNLLPASLIESDLRDMINTGILAEDLNFTEKGNRILLSLVFADYRKEIAKVALAQLKLKKKDKADAPEIAK